MTNQDTPQSTGLRELSPSEIEAVSGGWWGNPTVWDNPIPRANNWDHSKDDIKHTFGNFLAGWLGQTWGDADGDGFSDFHDYMNGGNDAAFHLHRSDGTVMGENPDGTFTLYDQNGTPSQTRYSLHDTTENTGGSTSAEAGRNSAAITITQNGVTYHFVPIRS